ncbi:hypothetical protein [Isoptericola sp. BMS4]|uniref:PH-like domain-containing protein n=1 Tax=Isoptericola sp. BMS4 TaxID=2527875 RepID=UPI001424583B|nr:hypothetical protein [Isoptericola sp. BMS4]
MNLPLPVAVGIWVVLGVVLLLAVLVGRRRLASRSDATVPPPPGAPSDLGAERLAPLDATYVCSTLTGDWLARVGAHTLGDRAAATVSVHDAGVLIERHGTRTVFVPAHALHGVGLAPGMAGKYVGADGLVVLTWDDEPHPDAPDVPAARLDTGLRTRYATDRSRLVDAVRHLMTSAAQQKDDS